MRALNVTVPNSASCRADPATRQSITLVVVNLENQLFANRSGFEVFSDFSNMGALMWPKCHAQFPLHTSAQELSHVETHYLSQTSGTTVKGPTDGRVVLQGRRDQGTDFMPPTVPLKNTTSPRRHFRYQGDSPTERSSLVKFNHCHHCQSSEQGNPHFTRGILPKTHLQTRSLSPQLSREGIIASHSQASSRRAQDDVNRPRFLCTLSSSKYQKSNQ